MHGFGTIAKELSLQQLLYFQIMFMFKFFNYWYLKIDLSILFLCKQVINCLKIKRNYDKCIF